MSNFTSSLSSVHCGHGQPPRKPEHRRTLARLTPGQLREDMFLDILADPREVNLHGNVDLVEHTLAADARELEYLWRLQCTG